MATAGVPTLISIAPNQGSAGTTVAVTLTGTNFIVGATTVTVGGGGVTVSAVDGVTISAVIVGSSTSLTANFVIAPTAAAGARTVTVTTAGGTSSGQTFTVSPPTTAAPTLTSVSPNQGMQGTTVAVTLTGTNFVVGATTVTVGGGGVTVTSVVVGSSTSLTANFVLDAAAVVGPRAVTVMTAGGTSGAQTFTVNLPVPTLTTIAPNLGPRGTTVAVTLTGANFVVGATTVSVAGGGVTVNTVIVGSTTSLTANFVLDLTAAPGGRQVTVTTAGGTSGPQTFTVGLLAPTLTSVAPNLGIQGTTVAVTLAGTNFVVGATTVAVSGAGVTITGVTVVDSTSLTANFVLDVTAALGARNVTVTTAFGTSGAQTFTINPPPPTLTNIAPNQGIKGIQATTVAVTLTGTNFVVGATMVTVSGAGVSVNAVVVSSSTSLTANFVLDPAAAVGPRTVTVTTAGGTSGGQTFTINPGSMSFAFTGGVQTFTVPPGVATLTVTAQGAQGGTGASPGGLGGSVTATLTVVPGEMLEVRVGGQGGTGGVAGFNGGGAGGAGVFRGGGGGASDIRRGGNALSNRVVVAGAGGGGAFGPGGGGAGGGTTGGAGTDSNPPNVVKGGGGGTQLAGRSGGDNPVGTANDGQPGVSGTGGAGGPSGSGGAAGGGGGGGYFGGGGGAGGINNLGSGAGGGGSSLDATGVVHTQGNRAGDGAVTITW